MKTYFTKITLGAFLFLGSFYMQAQSTPSITQRIEAFKKATSLNIEQERALKQAYSAYDSALLEKKKARENEKKGTYDKILMKKCEEIIGIEKKKELVFYKYKGMLVEKATFNKERG